MVILSDFQARLPRRALLLGVVALALVVSRMPGAHGENAHRNLEFDGQRPPPGPTFVSQIHNAPGWRPAHTYTYATGPFTRIVNGPGWDPSTSKYFPGRTLRAYQLVSPVTCKSAGAGGPQSTDSSIQDGSCTWRYVSDVDYISITGWAFDNRPWKSGSLYRYLDIVTSGSPLRAYALESDSCTSTVAPTGTGSSDKSTIDAHDGCQWHYEADIVYSSERSYIPTETFTTRKGAATLMMRGNYEARLWNDREYVAGQNGETSPIRTQNHDDYRHEGGVILGCKSTPCFHIILAPAPGESFRDARSGGGPLSGYDPRAGVAIRNTLPYRWPFEPAGFDVHDNFVDLVGLQIKSAHGAAVNGMSSFGNNMTIRGCILEGGSSDRWTSHAAVTVDTSSVLANSLVVSHAPMGVILKYPGFVLHSTIISADHIADSVGIITFYKWVYEGTTVSNTAIFGFAHAAGHIEGAAPWSADSSNNMTDAPLDDSGTTPWPFGGSNTIKVDVMPGTGYGVSMAKIFAASGRDWRPSQGSPLRGAGRPFGTFSINCDLKHPNCPQRTAYNFDSPDIVGTARPQAGLYDIGAWQSCSRCSAAQRAAPGPR